jgi:hypothetical protein
MAARVGIWEMPIMTTTFARYGKAKRAQQLGLTAVTFLMLSIWIGPIELASSLWASSAASSEPADTTVPDSMPSRAGGAEPRSSARRRPEKQGTPLFLTLHGH